MEIKTVIIGSDKNKLGITEDGAAEVVIHDHPVLSENRKSIPITSLFIDDSGSSDMKVTGSKTDQKYFNINSQNKYYVFIHGVSFVLSDASMKFNDFGNLGGALSNGIELRWRSRVYGEKVILNAKTNYDLFRFSDDKPSIENNVFGVSEGIQVHYDIASMFGMRNGIPLRPGSTETLSWVVQDDLSGLDLINAYAIGRLIPDPKFEE